MNRQERIKVLNTIIGIATCLVVVVLYFTIRLHNESLQTATLIKRERKRLEQMRSRCKNPECRNLIRAEQKVRNLNNNTIDFLQFVQHNAEAHHMFIAELSPQQPIERMNSIEYQYAIRFASRDQHKIQTLENMTKYIYSVESEWPGAKSKKLNLQWNKTAKSWSADVTFSIFKKR